MNINPKARRRISFTPIMLTSKSIRPVDRSDYQLIRHQRKFSGIKKTREDLSSYIFRNSNQFKNLAAYAYNQSNYNPTPADIHEQNLENQQFLKNQQRKQTPNIIQVQFKNDVLKNRKRMPPKRKEDTEIEFQEHNSNENTKFMYFTNAKTFEQFTKMSKIKPNRQLSPTKEDLSKVDSQGEWTKYLDKYYLNIRKVKPIYRKGQGIIISSQKDSHHSDELNDKEQKLNQIIQMKNQVVLRFNSNATLRAQSKKQSRESSKYPSQNKNHEGEYEEAEEMTKNSNIKKIEMDINNHRNNLHKKDFFVFGMSDTVGKSAEALIKLKFDNYKDFIFRVNFTNGLYVKSKQQYEKPLKVFVGFGNNSALVKGIMRRRFWWQLVDKITEDTNFVWSQLKLAEYIKGQNRSLLKVKYNKKKDKNNEINQEEKSALPNTKQEVNVNSRLMYGYDLKIWQMHLQKNSKQEQKGFQAALNKRLGLFKKKCINIIQNPSRLRLHNHLQCNYFLGNKKALFYSLKLYYQLMNIDPFTKIPLTFHIVNGLSDPEFQHFLSQFEKQSDKRKIDKDFRNIWIIKPGQLTNRGRGITVCSTLDQIKNRLKSKERNSNGTNRTFIVQKYIQKPLLYHKRKFDIRHYMATTCHNGRIKAYWYADGYIRTTSSEYNIKNTKDLFTHLTNDAVQKYGQDYGKFQKGNKVSYSDFQKFLTASVSADIDFQGQIIPKMKQLATECIRATYSILDNERKQHNFQLFGLDFMVDQNLNVILIQVNTNPCLQTSCPLLTKIITPLVQNLFKIGLDPLFPPPYEWSQQKKYLLGQNAFQDNKFSIIFDQCEQGQFLKNLYCNKVKMDSRMGQIDEQDQEYQDEQKEWNDDDQKETKKS